MTQEILKYETEHEVRNSVNKKRRGGRPRLLPCERRSFQVKIGFTPAQFQKLQERCESASLSEPEFIRRLAINQQITTNSKITNAALIELGRIGNNLNQIAKILNSKPDFEAKKELFLTRQSFDKLCLQVVNPS